GRANSVPNSYPTPRGSRSCGSRMEVGVPMYSAARNEPVGAKTFFASISLANAIAACARSAAARPTPQAPGHEIISSLRPIKAFGDTSLHANIGRLQDRPPFIGLGAHEGFELFGRTTDRHRTRLLEIFGDGRVDERGDKTFIYLCDNIRRHPGGAQKAPPNRSVVTGYAGFG